MLVGIALLGYGAYTLFFPHISLETGSGKVAPSQDNMQTYAMMALGLLSLLAGFGFRKR